MEYVEILAMILKSDDKITKEYCSALKGINTQFFIDKSMIDDTPAYKNTGNGFIAIYEHEGEIVLEYMFGGTGSIKSCTKKVKFEFNTNLKEDLLDLKPDKLTSDIEDDVFDYSQFCAACTMYNVKRDSVDFNHITETPKYSIDYYIRKFINNEYFLHIFAVCQVWTFKFRRRLCAGNALYSRSGGKVSTVDRRRICQSAGDSPDDAGTDRDQYGYFCRI